MSKKKQSWILGLILAAVILILFWDSISNLSMFSMFPSRSTSLKVGDVNYYKAMATSNYPYLRYTVLGISGSMVTFKQQAYDYAEWTLKDERTVTIDVQNPLYYDMWPYDNIDRGGNPYLPILCGRNLNLGDLVFYAQITSTFQYQGTHTRVRTYRGEVTQMTARVYCGLTRTINVVYVNVTSLVDGYPETLNFNGQNIYTGLYPISTWYFDRETGLLCEGTEQYPSPNLPRAMIRTSNVIPEFSNIIPFLLLFAILPIVAYYRLRHRKALQIENNT